MLMAYVFSGGTYRVDHFQSQSISIHFYAGNHFFDHSGNLISDHQLGIIKGDALSQHPQTVNHVDSGQSGNQCSQGSFVCCLGIGQIAVSLTTGSPARQLIILGHLGSRRTDQGQLGRTYR